LSDLLVFSGQLQRLSHDRALRVSHPNESTDGIQFSSRKTHFIQTRASRNKESPVVGNGRAFF